MITEQQERAVSAALEASEDLDLALLTARTPEDLRWVRTKVEDVIARLLITTTVAQTLIRHAEEWR